jgi:hypothetical protein
MEFAKYVISDVQNVWDRLQIVSHVQSTHFYTTGLAGIIVQGSCQMESVSTLVLQATTKSTIDNARNAVHNASLAIQEQIA